MEPNITYITKLLMDLKDELRGLHTRITETEEVRYLEDKIKLGEGEAQAGIDIRIGSTGEQIKNTKAAILTNPAVPYYQPLEHDRDGALENAAKRENFISRLFSRWNYDQPTFDKFADSLIGNGVGILKAARIDYPTKERQRLPGESAKEHVDRVRGLKRIWGPPIGLIDVHPLAAFWRRGASNRVVEVIENTYKGRLDTYRNYGIETLEDLKIKYTGREYRLPTKVARLVTTMPGYPDMDIQPLPSGLSTSTMCLATEYWSPDAYRVYLDRHLCYEENTPDCHVQYFFAFGETGATRDPDKQGFGVAELLRHNEPHINRMINRMAEANELLVRQRLTLEIPEGGIQPMEDQEQGGPVPKKFTFKPDVAESLPAGAKIINPFTDAQNVYQSLPLVELLLSIQSQLGVSPLFKGVPPSSNASGYRDNSLRVMAEAQLHHYVEAYRQCLVQLARWVEKEIVDIDETVYIDELELSPKDITSFPCSIDFKVTPMLPQNMIAEGTFWDRMWASRHVPRRVVREQGFNMRDPYSVDREVLLEDIKEGLKPQLILDVMSAVLAQPQAQGMIPPGEQGNGNIVNNQRNSISVREGVGQQAGQSLGGMSRMGQSRQPPMLPGELSGASGNGGSPAY